MLTKVDTLVDKVQELELLTHLVPRVPAMVEGAAAAIPQMDLHETFRMETSSVKEHWGVEEETELPVEEGETYAGGGSGGSLWVTCDRFYGDGNIFSNGGNGNRGGGGAGGRVTIYYNTGNFKSGHIEAKGGSSSTEPGGPGMAYMEGTNPVNKNLRVDNKCQQPEVTMPTGDRAGEEQFAQYIQTGAVAYLLPPEDEFEYEFTLIEVYGSAHLTVSGNRTTIRATQVLGDDTGYVHLPPYHTLHITEVSPYKRANITWAPYIYENATLILPTATIELRQPFDESQYNSDNCANSRLRSAEVKIWGTLDSSQAHVIVGSGGTLTMQLPSPRYLEMVGLTVQDGGTLQLNSHYGKEEDQWQVQVYPDEKEGKKRDGSVTLEGGGLLKARNLYLEAHTLTVDSAAVLDMSEQGDIEGPGVGSSRAGAGYGGQGGRGSISSGGILHVNITKVLKVEGEIRANGKRGQSYDGGGSGGSIWIHVDEFEGSGTVMANGGNGGTYGGGGGGGRIAVHWRKRDFWFGKLQTFGGRPHGSSAPYSIGGSGTIYMEDLTPNVANRTLIVDNNNQNPLSTEITNYDRLSQEASRTWIIQNQTEHEFEEIHVFRRAHLALHPDVIRYHIHVLHVCAAAGFV
ncbi:hypothetical protein Bbelb_408050 [Branchiostoma belcheri]|nr:hypothetical protein Bbelb_408050 [Branchiostoma belcheri]